MGSFYDVTVDRWHALSDSGLRRRRDALAVWTGQDLILFGGLDMGSVNAGDSNVPYPGIAGTGAILDGDALSGAK